MRKRRCHAAQNEDESQASQSALYGATVVKNVFGHGKSQTDHARIHDAVDDSVKLIFLPKEQDEENEGLGAFFHNRC